MACHCLPEISFLILITEAGLSYDNVYGVSLDQQENLWVATGKGVSFTMGQIG